MMYNHGCDPNFVVSWDNNVLKRFKHIDLCPNKDNNAPIGLIHDWGSKKRKKDSRTFVGLLFANNIYMKQI